MAKLRKDEVADIDVQDLDDAEYSEDDLDSYSGRVPDANTELTGYVARMFWCRTQEKDDGSGLDPMLKVLWIAGDNEGELEEYNGLPVVENLVLVKSTKFRWAPFFRVFGIELKDIKNATYVGDEDDERWHGAPIERIGTFRPGEDQDGAWSRLITDKEYFGEKWRARVKKFLPWEEVDGDGSGPDDEADDEAGDEEYDDTEAEEGDEEYDDEEGDEEEAEPEPPARGRRAAARPAPARAGTRTAAKPATARPARAARAAKPAAAATSSRGRRPAAASKPAATGRGRKPADNEPPF